MSYEKTSISIPKERDGCAWSVIVKQKVSARHISQMTLANESLF